MASAAPEQSKPSTPAPAAPAPSSSSAERKPSAVAASVSRTALGCLLGAFRDVAYSIGMQVLAVTLRARGSGEAGGETRAATVLPKGRSRRELKLIALVQTFADSVAREGYVLEKIDMKPVEQGEEGQEKKSWKVKVELKGRVLE